MCTTGVSQTSKGNKARMARLSVFPVSQVIPHKCANWQEIRVRRLSTPTGQLQSSDKRPAPGGRETLKDLVCPEGRVVLRVLAVLCVFISAPQ